MKAKHFTADAVALAALSAARADSLIVYLGTYTGGAGGSKGIYRSVLDLRSGRLADPVLAAEARNPAFLEIAPGGRFLYAVAEVGQGAVRAYAIGADGNLTFLNEQPSGGSGPCHVNSDAKGKYVFVANYGSGCAAVLPVNPDGSLAPPQSRVQHEGSGPNKQRQQRAHAHAVNLSPDDRFVYVADLGIDRIMIYRFDADQGLLAAGNPPYARLKPGAGPRHFCFHPSGRFAYVINELDCTITAFTYDAATGALAAIQTVPTLPEGFDGNNTCAEIRVHPTGRFVYGSNRGHDSVAAYRVDMASGTLSLVGHAVAGIKTPRNFNVDPSGKFCLVANQDADSVVVFRMDPDTGALEPTGHKVSVGRPVCIRFLDARGGALPPSGSRS